MPRLFGGFCAAVNVVIPATIRRTARHEERFFASPRMTTCAERACEPSIARASSCCSAAFASQNELRTCRFGTIGSEHGASRPPAPHPPQTQISPRARAPSPPESSGAHCSKNKKRLRGEREPLGVLRKKTVLFPGRAITSNLRESRFYVAGAGALAPYSAFGSRTSPLLPSAEPSA